MAKKTKMPTDVNQRAKAIVDFATGTEDVPDRDETRAAEGKKGGDARASRLSPERRSEIAKKAARTRWGSTGSS